MLRVAIETESEFDQKRANDKASDYQRTEIPGVCVAWYKPSAELLIIVRPDEEDQG